MAKEVEGLTLEQFLTDNAPPPPVGPDELTVRKAMKAWDIASDTARDRLEQMVKDGKLRKEDRKYPNGQILPAYIIVV